MATIVGTYKNEDLIGTDGADTITTNRGHHLIDGRGGYDTLIEDFSAYTALYVGSGANRYAQISRSTITANSDGYSGMLRYGSNTDTFSHIERIDYIGDKGPNWITVTESPALANALLNLDGGSGVDRLIYDATAYTTNTSFSVGATGVQTIRGTFQHFESFDVVTGSGNDTIVTGAYADEVRGGAGRNTINAGGGDDVIRSMGIDRVDGGDGFDQWFGVYSNATVGLSFGFSGTTGQVSDGTLLTNVEGFDFRGGAGNDTITIVGNYAMFSDRDPDSDVPGGLVLGGAGTDSLLVTATYARLDTTIRIDSAGLLSGSLAVGLDEVVFNQIEHLDYGSDFDIGSVTVFFPTALAPDTLVLHSNPDTDGYANLTAHFEAATSGVTFTGVSHGITTTSVGGDFSGFDSFTVYATSLADTLIGSTGNEQFYAGGGDDWLDAGSGDGVGTFDGGAGIDTLTLASWGYRVMIDMTREQQFFDGTILYLTSIENLTGSAFDDTITGNAEANVIAGGGGNDLLDGGGGLDTASYAGTGGGVTVSLAIAGPQDTGGTGIDTLVNFENLLGSGFADTLSGDTANNNIDGGSGIDTLTYAAVGTGVTVRLSSIAAQDTVGAGMDTIRNVENLTGSAFNDTLTGDTRANVVAGGEGDDILDGSGGIDTVSYADAERGVTVSLGTTTAQDTRGAGVDTIRNFENILGSRFDDLLAGDGGNNLIDGGAGIDTLAFGGLFTSVTGASANLSLAGPQNTGFGIDTIRNIENLFGTSRADVLTGDARDNVLTGAGGDDILTGGDGSDTASYASATAAVIVALKLAEAQDTGGAGSDTLSQIENLIGSRFADTLSGDRASNVLTGGDGDDRLDGGVGADTLIGGAGNDTYVVDNAGDRVVETAGGGTDVVRTSLASYTLPVEFETLTYSGRANFTGTGNAGRNVITGGIGADVLDGGGGIDRLVGGAGADHFVFDTALTRSNIDRISDFAVGTDRIDLSRGIFTAFAAPGALAASAFVSGAAAADADDRIVYSAATGALYYDSDGSGSGAALQIAILAPHLALASSDIFIIG